MCFRKKKKHFEHRKKQNKTQAYTNGWSGVVLPCVELVIQSADYRERCKATLTHSNTLTHGMIRLHRTQGTHRTEYPGVNLRQGQLSLSFTWSHLNCLTARGGAKRERKNKQTATANFPPYTAPDKGRGERLTPRQSRISKREKNKKRAFNLRQCLLFPLLYRPRASLLTPLRYIDHDKGKSNEDR